MTVVNKSGLHMRAAMTFVNAMTKYVSDISVLFSGKEINGKSILCLMAAGITCGSRITVICNGDDEAAMLAEAAALTESGFGEK